MAMLFVVVSKSLRVVFANFICFAKKQKTTVPLQKNPFGAWKSYKTIGNSVEKTCRYA